MGVRAGGWWVQRFEAMPFPSECRHGLMELRGNFTVHVPTRIPGDCRVRGIGKVRIELSAPLIFAGALTNSSATCRSRRSLLHFFCNKSFARTWQHLLRWWPCFCGHEASTPSLCNSAELRHHRFQRRCPHKFSQLPQQGLKRSETSSRQCVAKTSRTRNP